MSKPFKPGDRVVWWKQVSEYVVPVLSTVLAVTEKRVKIEAEEDEGKVIRYVLPQRIEHHAPPPKSERKPPGKSAAGRSKGSGRKPAAGRSKRSGELVVWSGGVSRPPKDEVREQRITMEIVVDAYNEDERAMGWYGYLEEKLSVPFRARCVEEREMFVSIDWGERTLAVPLAQLEVVKASRETREAVKDWHYWVGMGYSF